MICSSCSWAFTPLNFSWYSIGTLSKDHTRNKMPTRAKIIPFSRFDTLKKHTLTAGTYLSSPYMGVSQGWASRFSGAGDGGWRTYGTDHFRYIKIYTWLRGFGNKTKEMIYSLLSLLFYSPKPRGQVWILIYRKWSIWLDHMLAHNVWHLPLAKSKSFASIGWLEVCM